MGSAPRVPFLIPLHGCIFRVRAKVAELVDARDLGSRGLVPWGFESPLSHLAAPPTL